MTFSWINLLLELGYSKPLALKDIPSLASEDEAEIGYQKTICAVASPLLVYSFVKYSNSIEEDLNWGLTIVACLVLAKVVESMCEALVFQLKEVRDKNEINFDGSGISEAVEAFNLGLDFCIAKFFWLLFGVVGLDALPSLVPLFICGGAAPKE
ncbi:hypothetical protein PIB30_040640 [Stylosanthes scabra]|uniref:Uncharacterized protein n=1 Tax=Stylosanthes scabra TaxID=79078 RepID=A0ABU6WF19_9FABA|nr:hypothetical protein [Stylosanthes scabra]